MMKINTDAVMSKNSSTMALAAVARDEYGAFLGAFAVVMEGVSDSETAKAMAVREGLALARDLLEAEPADHH